jgi:succinate-acetate transporter protein
MSTSPDRLSSNGDSPLRITLRPLASPLPIGFYAFATGSLLFSAFELGWVAADQSLPLAIIMVTFVAPLELIASVLAFWARDPGGATALGLFGMTWATTGRSASSCRSRAARCWASSCSASAR